MQRSEELGVRQFPLRWNESLRKQIVEAARDNRRSINSEILARLERDLARPSAEDRGAA
jgi:hypothetical protein